MITQEKSFNDVVMLNLLEAAKDVIKTVTPSKLKGTIKENFSEQVSLAQLSKAIAEVEK